MKIPNSDRKKALIIVDVQDVFLTKRNKYILKNIEYFFVIFFYERKMEFEQRMDVDMSFANPATVPLVRAHILIFQKIRNFSYGRDYDNVIKLDLYSS